MHTRFYVSLLQISAVSCVTLKMFEEQSDVEFKVKSQLRFQFKPLEIYCALADIIVLSAPVIKGNESVYFLTRPDGTKHKLKFKPPRMKSRKDRYANVSFLNDYGNIEVRVIHDLSVIVPKYKHEVFNVNNGFTMDSSYNFEEYISRMEENDIIIGPIDESYHGNWDLSVYIFNGDGDLVEISQMFSILIIELVPISTEGTTRKDYIGTSGTDLKLQFAYPITELKTCELHAPRSTFDRFFGKTDIDLNKCSYLVTNLTMEDAGLWRIIGVGRIIYEASMYLNVEKPSTTNDVES